MTLLGMICLVLFGANIGLSLARIADNPKDSMAWAMLAVWTVAAILRIANAR